MKVTLAYGKVQHLEEIIEEVKGNIVRIKEEIAELKNFSSKEVSKTNNKGKNDRQKEEGGKRMNMFSVKNCPQQFSPSLGKLDIPEASKEIYRKEEKDQQ